MRLSFKGLFSLPLLRYVARLNHCTDRLARFVQQRARCEGDWIKTAVGGNKQFFTLHLHTRGKGTVDRALLKRVVGAVRSCVMDDIVKRAALQLREAVPGEPFGGLVSKGAVLLMIHDEDGHGRVV